MLTLENLTKSYEDSNIFEGISATFNKGVNLVLGASGVGKSTLLRICATQEAPTAGRVFWNGTLVADAKTKLDQRRFRQLLGYAPQKIDFPEDLTGMDFMLHMGALKGLSFQQTFNQSTRLFQRLGLDDANQKHIASWSGGMCRRLGLAQAFLGEPQCLVIDEPTAELDSNTATRVNDLIFEIAKSSVVLMTTHLPQALSDYQYQMITLKKQEK